MFFAIRESPGRLKIPPRDRFIHSNQTFADIACERKVVAPFRIVGIACAIEIVEKYTADASRPVSMLEKEICFALFAIFFIEGYFRVATANSAHRIMEGDRIGILLSPTSVEQRGQTAPPPSHALDVTKKRVFIWTAGTLGFQGWAISEMPDAQNRGSASAPGICLANSVANVPNTVDEWMPICSKTAR